MFSRFYYYNQSKFQIVLDKILEESNAEIRVGVNFTQQSKKKKSVPDGIFSQESFQVLIETKLYDNFSFDQLKNHLDGFDDQYKTKILIGISKNDVSASIVKDINREIVSGKYGKVVFVSITFAKIIVLIRDILDRHEIEMTEILDDYEKFCHDENLIDLSQQRMLAVTVGQSLLENMQFNLYFDPANRNHSKGFKYLGLYTDKKILAVGEVLKIVYCNYHKGTLIPQKGYDLDVNEDESSRIKGIIEKTDYYDLTQGMKFMIVDRFSKTSFVKGTPYSLRSKTYFELSKLDWFYRGMSAESLAELLNDRNWEEFQ